MTLLPVNLILFEPAELDTPLPRSDRRAVHILDVLRRKVGDTFDVALIDGPHGKATLRAIEAKTLVLAFAWNRPASGAVPAPGIRLLVGLPRPQTARDILRDATTLGATAIDFVRTEKSEPGYAQSTLWRSGEWRRHVLAGAEQAFDPRVPIITHGEALATIVGTLPPGGTRIALDNYEATERLGELADLTAPTLALGAERGWSATERALLRAHGFRFAQLGARVLRTETACVAALAIVRAKLGLM